MRQGQITLTIPLSGSISDDGDLRGGKIQAISVPTITSGDLLVQGGFDTTSASFLRLINPGLSNQTSGGDLRFATGPGSRMVVWPDSFQNPSFVRLETSVPQAAARAFTVRYSSA